MSKVTVRPSQTEVVRVRASRAGRVGTAEVTNALGAEVAGQRTPSGGSPITAFAIRQALAEELRSVGGRPGLSDADRRKIPVANPVWRMAEAMAARLAEDGFRPSPSQVASVVLTMAFRQFDQDEAQMGRARDDLRRAAAG